jgi:hypothetical protein
MNKKQLIEYITAEMDDMKNMSSAREQYYYILGCIETAFNLEAISIGERDCLKDRLTRAYQEALVNN